MKVKKKWGGKGRALVSVLTPRGAVMPAACLLLKVRSGCR